MNHCVASNLSSNNPYIVGGGRIRHGTYYYVSCLAVPSFSTGGEIFLLGCSILPPMEDIIRMNRSCNFPKPAFRVKVIFFLLSKVWTKRFHRRRWRRLKFVTVLCYCKTGPIEKAFALFRKLQKTGWYLLNFAKKKQVIGNGEANSLTENQLQF